MFRWNVQHLHSAVFYGIPRQFVVAPFLKQYTHKFISLLCVLICNPLVLYNKTFVCSKASLPEPPIDS